jgi:putative ABC transport system ATP-binding protein
MIELRRVKPTYMSESDIKGSDIFLQDKLVFERGKQYFIRANSGKGKTSALNFIYGSNLNFEGQILYDGKPYLKDITSVRQQKISYVFQDFRLFPEISLYENIILKNRLTNHKTEAEIQEMIDLVHLHHKRNAVLKTLSLGQKQRVAILRALCQPFEFLLMDEPFSHLDEENIAILSKLIQHETQKQGAGMILTSLGSEYLFNYDQILNV